MTFALLPRTIAPAIGEIFSSWIRRLARINQLSTRQLLQRCGYNFNGTTPYPGGYNLTLPPHILATIAGLTYIDPDAINETLLAKFRNSPLTMVDDHSEHANRLIPAQNWVQLRGSQYCPECLREGDGAWQLTWRFPWIYACLKHQRLMLNNCPYCNTTPGGGRRTGIPGTPFPTWIPSPTHCPNPAPKDIRRAGRAAQPCGQDLTRAPVGTSINSSDQQILEYLIAQLAVPNATENNRIWWSDLKAICSAILAVGETDTLNIINSTPLTPPRSDTWTAWLDRRKELEEAANTDYHRRSVSGEHADQHRKRHAQIHTWHRAPDSPALMQAILPSALTILVETEFGALDRAYQASRRHRNGKNWLALRLREAGISKSLSARMHEVIIRARSNSNRASCPCSNPDGRPNTREANACQHPRQLSMQFT